MKKHIPNILTLGNLLCGIFAIKIGFSEHYFLAGFFVILGAIFDFFDGFVARLLKVQGEIGKQLDSLADMVTFGVAPGVVMYSFLKYNIATAFLFQEGMEVEVKYSIIKKNGDWFVYDVYVEGVSLVNNYRVQFNRIMIKSSIDELLQRLEAKLDE